MLHRKESTYEFTSGFIGPEILNFESSLSLSPDLKAVLFRLANVLLEALDPIYEWVINN